MTSVLRPIDEITAYNKFIPTTNDSFSRSCNRMSPYSNGSETHVLLFPISRAESKESDGHYHDNFYTMMNMFMIRRMTYPADRQWSSIASFIYLLMVAHLFWWRQSIVYRQFHPLHHSRVWQKQALSSFHHWPVVCVTFAFVRLGFTVEHAHRKGCKHIGFWRNNRSRDYDCGTSLRLWQR